MPRDRSSSLTFLMIIYVATIVLSPFETSAFLLRRPNRRNQGNRTLTLVEKHTDTLYEILNKIPENELFKTKSCHVMEQEMPNFSAPNRRISEVKCLEYLWRIRFYDQLLLKKIRCKSDLDGIYVTFSTSTIYNGNQPISGKFTHTAAIGWKSVNDAWIFLCGGALISDRYLLTAAHCSVSPKHDARVADPTPKIVRLGEQNILDSNRKGRIPMDVDIKNFIVHDNYRYPFKYFDIALIELEVSVPFKIYSSPACVWSNDHENLLGEAYVAGWGVVESDETDFIPTLGASVVNLLQPEKCGAALKENQTTNWDGVISNQICGNYTSNDTCKGDSGGALVMPIFNPGYSDFIIHYIIGVESASYSCDCPNNPNIYTRVSSFVEWIEDIVWRNDSSVKEFLSEKNFAKIYENF